MSESFVMLRFGFSEVISVEIIVITPGHRLFFDSSSIFSSSMQMTWSSAGGSWIE